MHAGERSRPRTPTRPRRGRTRAGRAASPRVALTGLVAGLLLAAASAGLTAQEPAPAAEDRGPRGGVWNGIEFFARATLSDSWAVATQAVALDRSDWLTLAAVTGVGLAMVPFDDDIWSHVQANREHPGYSHVEDVAKVFEPFALQGRMNKYYAGGVVLGYIIDSAWDEPTTRHVFEELLIANLISATTRKTLGRAIGRFRPSTGEGPYHFEFWDGMSFPSGHVANIATLVTVLSHHIDWWPATALMWGGVGAVVYERVADSGHWPSDSWFGIFWGHAIAKIVIERREADHVEFGPIPIQPSSHMGGGFPLGIQIRF